jgi:hypothetical protein
VRVAAYPVTIMCSDAAEYVKVFPVESVTVNPSSASEESLTAIPPETSAETRTNAIIAFILPVISITETASC